MMFYLPTGRSRKNSRFISLRIKLLCSFSVLFGAFSAATYYWFYSFSTEKAVEQIQEDLSNVMAATAAGIDGQVLVSLYREAKPRADGYTDDPRYWQHVEWLATVEKIDPRAYIYTYVAGSEPNTIVFIGSGSAANHTRSFQGAKFLELYQPAARLYEGLSQQAIITTPYRDQWGYWITGYTPIFNAEGEKTGALGVDFRAEYVLQVQQAIRDRILVTFVITYGTLSILVYVLSGVLTRHLTEFSYSAADIGLGHYNLQLPAHNYTPFSDELDLLAQVFENMVRNIQNREQFLKAIVEDQTESICRFTPDGTLTFVNNAYCRQVKQPVDGLLGQNFMAFICQPERAIVWQHLRSLTATQPVKTFECSTEYLPQEASIAPAAIQWCEWTIRGLFDEQGKIIEIQAVGREITQQKQAESALRQSEEKYRLLVEHVPAITYIAATDKLSGVFYISPQVEQFLGYTQADFQGQRQLWFQHLHPDDRDRVLAELAYYYHQKVPFVQEYRLLTRTGEERWVRDNAVVLMDASNQPSCLQGVMFDITVQKQTEEALQQLNAKLEVRVQERTLELRIANIELARQAEQLKVSLTEKELLLKEVHHRVKNNLQVISSIFSLQSQYVEDPQVLATLAEGKDRIRAMALIHEKLYQSGNLSQLDLAEYIPNLAHSLFMAYNIHAGQLQLKLQIAKVALNLDTAIPCGLLMNELISNALKHAFPNGRSGEIALDCFYLGTHICLSVRDNGVGFPSEVDLQQNGSLGLRLVRALTRQLEGTLTLDQAHGTTFRIIFPNPVEQEAAVG